MLDLSKPVQTRDGRPVRILSTDRRGGEYPIVALVSTGEIENVATFTIDGKCGGAICRPHTHDLVNIPERRFLWLNIYANDLGSAHTTKQAANIYNESALGQIEIIFENDRPVQVILHGVSE